jgi:hypothetical protein
VRRKNFLCSIDALSWPGTTEWQQVLGWTSKRKRGGITNPIRGQLQVIA